MESQFSKDTEFESLALKAAAVAAKHDLSGTGVKATQDIESARQKNLDLSKQITEASLRKQGIDPAKMQKGMGLSQKIVANSGAFLQKNEDSIARDLFAQKYQREASADELSNFKIANNQRIQDSIFGSLSSSAREVGIDITKDPFYAQYVGREVTRTTPKEQETSWGSKVAEVGKSLFDTAVGATALVSDGLGVTDNLYKDWFGERTELTGKEGLGTKAWDLFFAQQAWVDVAFAAATIFTGGAAAPAWIGAKTAAGAGLKVAGKTAFKFLEKEAVKEGTELFAKSLLKEGAEVVEKNIVKDLSEKLGGEVAEQALKAFKTGEGITDLIKSGAKGISGKEIGDALVESVGRNITENLSEKGAKKVSKALGKFGEMVDTIHNVGQLSVKGKAMLAGSHLVDALGVPGLSLYNLVPTGTKTIEKEATKGLGGTFAKEGLRVDTSVFRVGLYGGLPFAGTLPGVGNFIQNNVMQLGNQVAGFFVKETRTGVVDQERQKFIEKYGIDPDKSDDVGIKKAFEDQINYRIRHSLPSEILTGVSYGERGMFGQATSAIVDGLANMAGLMILHHGIGKMTGLSESYLSPISRDENGNVTSNIGFLKEMDAIHDEYKNGGITAEQRDNLIGDLKERVQNGDTDLITTIKSTRELESTIKEAQQYIDIAKDKTKVDLDYTEHLENAVKALQSNPENMNAAMDIIGKANELNAQYASSIFSEDNIKRIQNKTDLLGEYLKKVGESTSFMNQITRPLITNLFTSDYYSPTAAALNYNKMNAASEKALSMGKAIFDEILEPQRKIATLFEQKGEYLKNLKNDSVFGKALEEKITANLSKNGFSESDARTTAEIVGKQVQLELTRVYLAFKDSKDILNLLNPVFGDFGVTLKKVTAGEKSSTSAVANIISALRGTDYESTVKLSTIVSSMMDEKYRKALEEKDQYVALYRQHAQELIALDRVKTDAISRLNYEREAQRTNALSPVPTERTEVVRSQRDIEAAKEAIRNSGQDQKIIDAQLKAVDDGRLYKVDTPKLSDETVDTIVHNTDAVLHVDPTNIENKFIKIENDVRANKSDIEPVFDKVSNTILDLHQTSQFVQEYLPQVFKALDIDSPKNDDDVIRNMTRIKTHLDFVNKSIDLEGLMRAAVDFSDTVTIKSIMAFDDIRNKKFKEMFNEKLAIVGYDESDASRAQILRMANEISAELVKPLKIDTFRDLARESASTGEFLDKVHNYLVDRVGFIPEYADQIIANTFKGSETYLFNQYKETVRLSFVQIDSKDKVVHSEENIKPFLDKNGNDTHLYRIGGIGAEAIKNSGAVIVDKFFKDGKEVDPIKTFTSKDHNDPRKAREIFDEQFKEYIDVMEKKGYEYVGPFQEEGKKLIFVPASYGADRFIQDITGIEAKKVNQLGKQYIDIIGGNLAKRGKLALWGELHPDTDTWLKAIEGREDKNVRVLYFDDKIKVDDSNVDSFDGETFVFGHMAEVLNKTIGAGKENLTWKPVLVGDAGNFVKSQSSVFHESDLQDKMFQDALTKFADKDKTLYEGVSLKEAIETFGFKQGLIDFIENHKVIDMVAGASSYKNIYKGVPNEMLDSVGIRYTRPEVGDVVGFSHDKMGLKSIDFGKTPEYAQQETVMLANQVERGFSNLSTDLSINNDQNIRDIYSILNDAKIENVKKLTDLIKKIPEDPVRVLSDIAEEFGIKYSDPNYQNFISTKNVQNVTNMLTNIIQRNANTGIELKGNSLRVRSVPRYNEVRDGINKVLVEKFGDKAKDNFIILDRETYGHLAGQTIGDTQFLTYRYPIVSPKVLNAPHIIFTDELGKLIGDESFKPRMDDGAAISHKLMLRFEGDNDGDKLYMVTDKRLDPVKKQINEFTQDAFNSESKAFNFKVEKQTRAYHGDNLLDVFREAGTDQFEGKANIGKIDKAMTITDIFMRSGLIDNSRTGFWNGKPVTAKEEFAGKVGEFLQKAVDNQELSMNDFHTLITEYFSASANEMIKLPKGEIPLSKISWVDANGKQDGFFKYLKQSDKPLTNGLIRSPVVTEQIRAALRGLEKSDYKLVEKEGKYGKYQVYEISNPEKAKVLGDILQKYSIKNVETQLRGVLDFVGKVEYTDTGIIPRNIENFDEDYKTAQPHMNFFQENQNIFSTDNYLFDYVSKISAELPKFSKDTLDNMKTSLREKIDSAFKNAKTDFAKFGELTEGKLEDVNKLLKDYSRGDKDTRKALKLEIVDLKKNNPKFDLDSYIISRFNYDRIPMDLLSKGAKDMLSNNMTLYLAVGKIDDLRKLYPDSEVDALKATVGTPQFDQTLSAFMDKHSEFLDDFALNPAKYSAIGIDAPESIKQLHSLGITPETLTDTVKRVNSMEKNDRVDTYVAITGINPEHIADVLKDLNDENIYKEMALTFGMSDVIKRQAAEQTLDAAKNADKIYDPKLPEC